MRTAVQGTRAPGDHPWRNGGSRGLNQVHRCVILISRCRRSPCKVSVNTRLLPAPCPVLRPAASDTFSFPVERQETLRSVTPTHRRTLRYNIPRFPGVTYREKQSRTGRNSSCSRMQRPLRIQWTRRALTNHRAAAVGPPTTRCPGSMTTGAVHSFIHLHNVQ